MIPDDVICAAKAVEDAVVEPGMGCEVVGIVKVLNARSSLSPDRLTADEQRRLDIALPLLRLKGCEFRVAAGRASTEHHVGLSTIYRWVKRLRTQGPRGLRRKRRSDADKSSLPEGALEMLRTLLRDPQWRKRKLSAIVAAVHLQSPTASTAALRHMAHQILAVEDNAGAAVEWWALQIDGNAAVGEARLRAGGWPGEAREPDLLLVRPVTGG